ncbi:MAG: hypothetical protein KJ886_05230 [Candidatus Thermoplasmatota archaeon]|nr:hypothetical protein [Candidatus Thermoplasmatota archaeon]
MPDYCLVIGANRGAKMRLRQYCKRTSAVGKTVCFGTYLIRWDEKTKKYIINQINKGDVLIYYITVLTKWMMKKLGPGAHILIAPDTRTSKERIRKWVLRNNDTVVRHICYGTYILRYTKRVRDYIEKHIKKEDAKIYGVRRIEV